MASAARQSLWVSPAVASLKGAGTFFLKTLVVSFCSVALIWVSPGCSWKPCRSSAVFPWPALVSSRDALSASSSQVCRESLFCRDGDAVREPGERHGYKE